MRCWCRPGRGSVRFSGYRIPRRRCALGGRRGGLECGAGPQGQRTPRIGICPSQGPDPFTYLHLAGAPRGLAEALLTKRTSALAYETLEDAIRRPPLLAPMTLSRGTWRSPWAAIIWRDSTADGARNSAAFSARATARWWSSGMVWSAACGADRRRHGRSHLHWRPRRASARDQREIPDSVDFFLSSTENIAMHLTDADLVVGAVLVPGARAPRVITKEMVKSMPRGSVIVDVSIDQGGCIETSRPTSHSAPVFEKHGVIPLLRDQYAGGLSQGTSTLRSTRRRYPMSCGWRMGGCRRCGVDVPALRRRSTPIRATSPASRSPKPWAWRIATDRRSLSGKGLLEQRCAHHQPALVRGPMAQVIFSMREMR